MKRSLPVSIPQIRGRPLIGNILAFRFNRLALFMAISRTCADIGIFYVGRIPVVMLNSADYAATVLVDQADRVEKLERLNHYLYPVMGNGLLTSKNAFHKGQRKLIAPLFHPRRIGAYGPVIVQATEQLQATWASGMTINIVQAITQLTLHIIAQTLFHIDVTYTVSDLTEAFRTISRYIADIASASPVAALPMTWPTPRNRRFHQAIGQIDALIARQIALWRQMPEDTTHRTDLLALLLQTQQDAEGAHLSDQQVRDEIMAFLFAGHETVASAIIWTCVLLAQHPDCYRRMQSEVANVLGERSVTADDLPHLPYTLQVFKEAMRLYPPAYVVAREVAQPITLGSYQLPIGTILAISPYTLHRRPEYFPDPDRFDPDRFRPEVEAQRPRYTYLPFSTGPRGCIGNHFALTEAQMILATLAQYVTLELVPDQQIHPVPMIALRPPRAIRMIVHRRKLTRLV